MRINKKLSKKNGIIIGVCVLAVMGVVFFIFRGRGGRTDNFVTVQRGDVVEEVSITGKVVPSKNLDLAFEKGGRVKGIYVSVGKKVSRGTILAELENSDLYADTAQKEATLKSEQARLDELKRGTRPEEIAVKQAALGKAEQDLRNYFRGALDILNDSYAKADDAVRTKTADIFTDDDTANPKLSFTVSDAQAGIDVQAMRIGAGIDKVSWRNELQTLDDYSPEDAVWSAIISGEKHLSLVRDFLTRTLDALGSAQGETASVVNTHKANVYTARTNVNASYTSLSSQKQSIDSGKKTVSGIQNELNLALAGTAKEQIDAQEAKVEQTEAGLMYSNAQYIKTVLRAPFSGMVTKVDGEVGDIAEANSPIVSVIGSGNFEIEANVAESDIARVKIGNAARVTLDAYGKGVVFSASVTQINLSETVIEGVATYKAKLTFAEGDERILSGLTADVDIMSGKKENTLFLPTRNIIIDGGKYFVNRIAGDGSRVKAEVMIGLKGSDGRTEILSGILEGDKIAVE